MITYIDNLFLTGKTDKKLSKIKRRLRLGAGMTGLYFIMLSENPNDVFDIVPAPVFKQRSFRHRDHTIVGITESMSEAYSVVGDIVLEHYERTGKYTGLKDDFVSHYIKAGDGRTEQGRQSG
jgi:hypothetical protein